MPDVPMLDVLDELEAAGVRRGDPVALVLAPEHGVAIATASRRRFVPATTDQPAGIVQRVESALRPRWVQWSQATAASLVELGVRVATAWDIAAVHRLLFGGWHATPDRVWAQLHHLALDALPTTAPLDLFSPAEDGSPDDPVRPDGYLRPDWVGDGWRSTPARLERWAALAFEVAELQRSRVLAVEGCPRLDATARVESTTELLCAELARDGLPVHRGVAEKLIASQIGPRSHTEADAAAQRARRDADVLRHAPLGVECDLRSPGQVKALLQRAGIDVPDTRAFRLEALRDQHPLVDALLAWRKAERIATTYGYRWLDEQLDADGRLRGTWSAADGAAGRMTASAGLHNMPADMRDAVIAEPGHVFVRADLGQIEPRVLAAISGDLSLARATEDADMYAPVARELGVDRATAKVAVLGAMYGQTTGHGARALRRLETAYPVAMAYLDAADNAAQLGHDLRTHGGRLVRMGSGEVTRNTAEPADPEARARASARGRYGRNAMVQGAAAELFKTWAVTVRARAAALDARIVLCLHDELLVHAPVEHGDAAAQLLDDCLQEAAHRWAPDDTVRFVADIAVLTRWSDAKG